MNKAKKEEARKLREASETMSETEFQEFMQKRQIESFAHQVHSEMFPEEYDFMMDSSWDASDRRKGKNPMITEHTERVNIRRKKLGVPPLGPNGLPTCRTSWEVALAEAERRYLNQQDQKSD